MQTLQELGASAAARRRSLDLRQGAVAQLAGITAESLSRFERGRSAEFGASKLLGEYFSHRGRHFRLIVNGISA